jgi:hypothetical protein
MHRLRAAFARPWRIELHDGRLRLALRERRRGRAGSISIEQLCLDLRLRLLANGHAEAPELTRHLALVHDTLQFQGWTGVRALSPGVLRRALAQAAALAEEEPSAAIAMLQDRLQAITAALEATSAVEVLEISYAQFERTA